MLIFLVSISNVFWVWHEIIFMFECKHLMVNDCVGAWVFLVLHAADKHISWRNISSLSMHVARMEAEKFQLTYTGLEIPNIGPIVLRPAGHCQKAKSQWCSHQRMQGQRQWSDRYNRSPSTSIMQWLPKPLRLCTVCTSAVFSIRMQHPAAL